jgi:hypothetical protein
VNSRVARALVVCLLVLTPSLALAGPPLLCFPMSTDAGSLPWGSSGWNSPRADYDRSRLAADTIALLGPETPVLARMETLRRAVIYASSDQATAKALFAALRQRAGHDDGRHGDALAVFDLGYAAEAYRQTRHTFPGLRALDPPEDGYALIKRALGERGRDAEMEYAAALVSASRTRRGASDQHLRQAVTNARNGSDLAKTIAAHHHLWGDRVASLRAEHVR